MPMLTKGRYKAKVNSVKVDRKGANKLACISMVFEGYEWKNDATGEYEAIPESGYSIIADKFIEKKDGTLNESGIRQLAEVFEWNGSMESVADFVGKHAKITVVDDVWNGKTTPKVDWINHIDSGDEYFTFDHSAAKQVQAALGPKIRAILGTPAPARPAAPASRPPAAPTAPAAPAKAWDEEGVCNALVSKLRAEGVEAAEHEKAWFCLLGEVANAKSGADVKDWGALGEALAEWVYVPF